MSWVDLVLVLLLIGAAAWGGNTGLVAQAIIFLGLVMGLVAGAALAVWVSERIGNADARAAGALAVLFGITAIFYVGAASIGTQVRHKVPEGGVRVADAFAGTVAAMFGIAVLLAWLIAIPLAESPFPRLSAGVKDSFLMRVVEAAPPPRNVLTSLRSALEATGFPPVFDDLQGALGRPVAAPDPGVASDPDVDAVGDSTVRILGIACGNGSEGSGWVLAPGYVVTNAHVVAGTRDRLRVETRDGDRYKGEVVRFDPATDVAVVHAPDLPLRPVPLVVDTAPWELSVAAIGYPENGPYDVAPGRVRLKLSARGRDIYDDRIVDRSVYELAARIRPGNSGGPLVSPTGQVLGMIFAASSTDNDIGYALTGDEVQHAVDGVVGARSPVDTGECVT